MRSIGGAPSRVASRRASRVKPPRRNDEALVRATHHGASEVSDGVRPDIRGVSLALEEHRKADQPPDLDYPVAVNTPVSRALRHFHLREA